MVSEAHGGFYVNLSTSHSRATPRPIDTASDDSTQGRENPDDPSGLSLKLVGAEMGEVVVRVRLIERRDEQEMDLASGRGVEVAERRGEEGKFVFRGDGESATRSCCKSSLSSSIMIQ